MTSPTEPARTMSAADAADALGVSTDTVRRWGRSGYLERYRVGPARVEYGRASVEKRIRDHATPVEPTG